LGVVALSGWGRLARVSTGGGQLGSLSAVPPSARAVPRPRYLIIVDRDEPALCPQLAQRFAGDPGVRVLIDRRRRARRGQSSSPFCTIVEASLHAASQKRERRRLMEGLEDRQRVDRWIEESQYLIGRMIPGLLDDRERLRGKLEVAEQESARLRQEIGELRKEVSDLQSETQFFRGEHVAMAAALRDVIEHLGQIHKPLHDVHRRLQVTQPALSDSTA